VRESEGAAAGAPMPARRWMAAFALLFICYQLPEGLGARWLHQPALAAGLMLAFLPIAWVVARRLGRGMGEAYALEWSARPAAWLSAAFVLALAAKAAALWAGSRLGVYATDLPHAGAPVAMALAWLGLSTFVPSIAEDIVTRGFWARIPGWRWSGPAFVAFATGVYVLNHIYRLGNGPVEWLMLSCYGLAYATAFWRTGTLWGAVGLHWGWNFAGPALDMAWPVNVVDGDAARLVSAAAHLGMLAILLLATPPRRDMRKAVGLQA